MAGLFLEKTSHVEQFLQDIVSDSSLPEVWCIPNIVQGLMYVSPILWKLVIDAFEAFAAGCSHSRRQRA